MDQFTRGPRRLVVLVLAAMAGLMPTVVGAAAPAKDKLQVLVNETAAQLQLTYRQHPAEQARRREQLLAVVAAWRAAPRSEANNERLATWLRAAIVSSMPGSQEPLPPAPSFVAIVKTEPKPETHPAAPEPQAAEKEPQVVEKAVETQVPVEATAKPADDPIRDDPVSEAEQK
jgi:hypothetical protein